jgi:hypothetical protein
VGDLRSAPFCVARSRWQGGWSTAAIDAMRNALLRSFLVTIEDQTGRVDNVQRWKWVERVAPSLKPVLAGRNKTGDH